MLRFIFSGYVYCFVWKMLLLKKKKIILVNSNLNELRNALKSKNTL